MTGKPEFVTIRTLTAEYANLRVDFTDGCGYATIEVYGPRLAFGESQAAEVNWGGIGSKSPQTAVEYAEAIKFAATLATNWAA
jgi:hypothetical protein